MQVALAGLITPQTSDAVMTHIVTYLWFIWKARNELRFRKNKWSISQVQHATQAHINTQRLALSKEENQQMLKDNTSALTLAGTRNQDIYLQQANQDPNPRGSGSSQGVCQLPVMLDGPICYTDASIAPDGKVQAPRKAGLGIFIHDPRRKLKLFIKVQAQGCSSVLVAEAVALSVASEITAKLDMNQINFLTDSQTLANFLNGSDLESPPKWRIKPYTQRFINATRGKSAKILKIDRNLNSTAHFLAAQAFRLSDQTTEGVIVVCKNPSHDANCLIQEAIYAVISEPCTTFAALCC